MPIILTTVNKKSPKLVAAHAGLPSEAAAAVLERPGGVGFIYLASQSPRRRQLLEQLGVRHELLLPDADEDAEALEAVLPNEAPAAYVKRVTQLKLDAALIRLQRRGLPSAPVLCSDTTVALGRTIYGKPVDASDAARMLAELSGKTHRVLTAVALGTVRRREQALSESRVTFASLSPQHISSYVDTQEPMGKAGAYAVQGRAAAFISQMSGSYSGIMGLPMFETAQMLRCFDFEV
jgi:septum formation protein